CSILRWETLLGWPLRTSDDRREVSTQLAELPGREPGCRASGIKVQVLSNVLSVLVLLLLLFFLFLLLFLWLLMMCLFFLVVVVAVVVVGVVVVFLLVAAVAEQRALGDSLDGSIVDA
ncbi:unnamed protein product, partial [Polarella glacialis]